MHLACPFNYVEVLLIALQMLFLPQVNVAMHDEQVAVAERRHGGSLVLLEFCLCLIEL